MRRPRAHGEGIAGQKIGKADGLETGQGRQIDVGIEIGMRGFTALGGGLDPRLGRQNIGTARQQIGGQCGWQAASAVSRSGVGLVMVA